MHQRLGLILLFAVGFCPGASHAASYDGRPKILLHSMAATFKNSDACQVGRNSLADCSSVNTSARVDPSSGYFTYLVVAKGNATGVYGFWCGITYQNGQADGQNDHVGLDILTWQLCADLEFQFGSPWPAPGSGNLIVFDKNDGSTCPTGDVAIAGWFYLAAYSPDGLHIIKRPVDSRAVVATWTHTCLDYTERYLENHELGSVAFSAGGVAQGCNPCLGPCPNLPTPVEGRTWGAIKNMY